MARICGGNSEVLGWVGLFSSDDGVLMEVSQERSLAVAKLFMADDEPSSIYRMYFVVVRDCLVHQWALFQNPLGGKPYLRGTLQSLHLRAYDSVLLVVPCCFEPKEKP